MAGQSITWIDPNGVAHPFDNSAGVLAIIGEQGQYYPPIANLDQRTPLQVGTSVRFLDVLPRPLVYPLEVTAATETALRALIRNMTGWFNTSQKPGTLQAIAPDGTIRTATCYYVGGLEGDGSYPNRTPSGITFPLQLLAADPFWYDPTYTVVTPALAQPAFLSNPFLPLKLGGSTLATEFLITNNGDWETWPIWQIQGPASGIILSNLNTNKTLNLTNGAGLTLAANEVLTIDTSFGVKTVKKQDGSSQAGFVVPGSIFFSLQTGPNALSVVLAGTTAQTSVQVTYRQRWLSQ